MFLLLCYCYRAFLLERRKIWIVTENAIAASQKQLLSIENLVLFLKSKTQINVL